MTSLHEDLSSPQSNRFLNLTIHFLMGDHIGVCILFVPPEGTKLTVDIADVGIVDVAVDDVGDDVVTTSSMSFRPMQPPASIGKEPQLFQGKIMKPSGFGEIDPSAVPNLLHQLVDRGIVNHVLSLS